MNGKHWFNLIRRGCLTYLAFVVFNLTPRAFAQDRPPQTKTEFFEQRAEDNGDSLTRLLLVRAHFLALDIDDLKDQRRQYGLGLPISLMASGAIVAYLGVAVAALQSLCIDNCEDNRDSSITPLFIAALGAGTAVGGFVVFTKRLGPLRDLGHQIEEKQRQLKAVRESLAPFDLRASEPIGLSLSLPF